MMGLDIERIQALCFDVDGTLRDTDDQFVAVVTRWIYPFRFLLSGRDAQNAARKIVMELESPATFLFGIPDLLNIDPYFVRILDYFRRLGRVSSQEPFHPLIPGVLDALAILGKQYPLAIVSNRDEKSVSEFVEAYHLKLLFQSVIHGQTCHHAKPNPEPVLKAAEQMGIEAENCLMIGDTTIDIVAGKKAGAQTVGVLCGFGEEEELRIAGADQILFSPAELPSLLRCSNLDV